MRAAVRLHVRVIGAEQFFRAIDGGLLDDIAPFTAAVVTLAGIALGVLVREHRARRFEHSFADKVFAGDQLKAVSLARDFVVNGVSDQGIDFGERGVEFVIHLFVSDQLATKTTQFPFVIYHLSFFHLALGGRSRQSETHWRSHEFANDKCQMRNGKCFLRGYFTAWCASSSCSISLIFCTRRA